MGLLNTNMKPICKYKRDASEYSLIMLIKGNIKSNSVYLLALGFFESCEIINYEYKKDKS